MITGEAAVPCTAVAELKVPVSVLATPVVAPGALGVQLPGVAHPPSVPPPVHVALDA
jgi:hypothetical protein